MHVMWLLHLYVCEHHTLTPPGHHLDFLVPEGVTFKSGRNLNYQLTVAWVLSKLDLYTLHTGCKTHTHTSINSGELNSHTALDCTKTKHKLLGRL